MPGYNAELERLFRRQFRIEDDRLVFRRDCKGRPVPVTHDEADAALRLYTRRHRLAMISIVAASIAGVLALVLVDNGRFAVSDGVHWLLIPPLLVLIALLFRWSWYGPTANFERRTPVGSERSRKEIRAEILSDWGWPRVLGGLVFGLLLTVPHVLYWPPDMWDEWLWFGLGVVLVVVSGLNCFQKWQHGRSSL